MPIAVKNAGINWQVHATVQSHVSDKGRERGTAQPRVPTEKLKRITQRTSSFCLSMLGTYPRRDSSRSGSTDPGISASFGAKSRVTSYLAA